MPSENPTPLPPDSLQVQLRQASNVRRPGWLLIWMLLLGGLLRSEPLWQQVFGAEHSICGVWGCGPPISSLLVWQGSIAVLLIPAAVIMATQFPLLAWRWGKTVLTVTLAAAGLFLLINTVNWWQGTSALARGFVIRRILFATVSFTDTPVVPCGIAAAVFWWLGRKRPDVNAVRALSANSEQ
jgi:hypothetical protein